MSLSVARGACHGLVGESGSGKTTLARAVAGLLRFQAGEIRIGGQRLDTHSAQARRELWRRVQYVHQTPQGALNPRRRVGRILGAPLESLLGVRGGERDRRVARALESVGLEPAAAARYPHAFSGGQAQRIAVARALVVEPELVLLDEPTSSLDVRVQARLLALLDRLRRETGTAYLFISHDLAVVEAVCDTLTVLHDGRAVESGRADEVLRRPRADYTRELIASVPRWSRATTPATG